MKNILILLLFFSLNIFSQHTKEKVIKSIIDDNEIDSLNKTAKIRIGFITVNELNTNEIEEINMILNLKKFKSTFEFDLNLKIKPDGTFTIISGSNGIKRRRCLPEELKGFSEFENEYYTNQKLIDFLNQFFERKNLKLLFFKDKKIMEQITDMSYYSSLTYYMRFYFVQSKK
ncbi:hypothetical protein [Flavobacterium sp. H122]|uniref:hypothetical protein n=1 Tax=Flavobacterium sp. H122 TaxID=2529860 RepID=UPI0010AA5820|nr:hypothetical protein [Flavobacterium sp. H122]